MASSLGRLLCGCGWLGNRRRKGRQLRNPTHRTMVELERSSTRLDAVFTCARTLWAKGNYSGGDPGNGWGLHGLWIKPRVRSTSPPPNVLIDIEDSSYGDWTRVWDPLGEMSHLFFLRHVWREHGAKLKHTTHSQYFNLGVKIHDELHLKEKIQEALARVNAPEVTVDGRTWKRADAATLLSALEDELGYRPILKAIKLHDDLFLYEVKTEINYNELGGDYEVIEQPTEDYVSCRRTDYLLF